MRTNPKFHSSLVVVDGFGIPFSWCVGNFAGRVPRYGRKNSRLITLMRQRFNKLTEFWPSGVDTKESFQGLFSLIFDPTRCLIFNGF